MSNFHQLKVVDVKNETGDTVSVAFEVPEHLKDNFKYVSGQYITLRFMINGKDERRSYSMCSSPVINEPIRVAVKRVDKGIVSNHINNDLKIGDFVDVMAPQGNFILQPDGTENIYVAFAAGSGITPIWSMIKTVLIEEPRSKFVLFYGNRTSETAIFNEELKNKVGDQLQVTNVFSRENSGKDLTNGRIDKQKAIELLKADTELLKAKAFFMCGPEEMIFGVSDALKLLGVSEDKVKYELFTTPVLTKQEIVHDAADFVGTAKVKVIYDDEEIEFDLHTTGDNVLEAAMKHDVDAPFSCKGAVCCTCKAKVTEGKMIMDANYALSDEEVKDGFVLTCQAHPASEYVVVDFDEA